MCSTSLPRTPRRGRDQILAMGWGGDPSPYVDLIPAYGPRADAVEE